MVVTLYEEVRAALRETNFRPRKSRGQNFLIHERVIDSIIRLLDLSPADEVVEIGPGLGFLTRRLLERAARVWAVEVDAALVERLGASVFAADPKLRLIHGDILEVPLGDMLPDKKLKLVGNLPYSISTPVLFRIFALREHFSSLVLMVQKEVADRIAAQPGTKTFGTLSVWCQIHGRIIDRVSVSPEAFFPRPKVRSTVLKIELFPEPLVTASEIPILRGLVRAAFGQRRKTLGNALTAWLKSDGSEIETLLQSQGIDPRRRGETLSIDEFIKLARAAHSQSALAADH
ncbi:MAG: 16S rRNA (adenine(1518)-N(6)/adenine(1519)-N(6))-dimethyltransferase RsmA [Deltaproteobacteria bacterium]|nr:MAG: 16S rRNA (adenine(1518)-N(6)/adenine(1519)-N(6))-dimethyltransferase RsmA [Deltaproteobacteria bacterium]